MTKKKKSLIEILPSTESINLDFRSIIFNEIRRMKKASESGLSNEEHQNLKSLASTYKTVETESREQEKADQLHRLSQEELLELAARVINSLPEEQRRGFILALVESNQRLLGS